MIFVPFLWVYILAAVLPAVILLRYIYQHDTIEKEPPGLILLLVLMGVLSALAASVLEMFAQGILNLLVTPGTRLHTILLAFVVVAAVEEGTKFWLLKRRSWTHPAFNYRFDGIVYSVAVSLGFAGYENIQYVLHYGLSVALPRALLAVPGHMSLLCVWVFITAEQSFVRTGETLWKQEKIFGRAISMRFFCTVFMMPARCWERAVQQLYF